ncbi:FAD synthase [uncultured archaeon]|nr:FAD synthase [uncultured archaeon]
MIGLKTVLAFGCFDVLHYGHLQFLQKSRELGDRLVVVVARDSTIRKLKEREPIFDENARLEMVSALKIVDDAMLGSEQGRSRYDVIKKVKPDVIALGYDQCENELALKDWLTANGMGSVQVARITHVENDEVFKSSKAVQKIREAIMKDI